METVILLVQRLPKCHFLALREVIAFLLLLWWLLWGNILVGSAALVPDGLFGTILRLLFFALLDQVHTLWF